MYHEWARIPVIIISLANILVPIDKGLVPHTKLVISLRKSERILNIWRSFIGSCINLTMRFQKVFQAISLQLHWKHLKFTPWNFFGTLKDFKLNKWEQKRKFDAFPRTKPNLTHRRHSSVLFSIAKEIWIGVIGSFETKGYLEWFDLK